MKDDLGTRLDQLARLSDGAPLPDESSLRHLGDARHTRRRVLMTAASVVVAVAIATPVAFVFAGNSNHSPPASHNRLVARYVPASSHFSTTGLASDARAITKRLGEAGYQSASAVVQQGSIVIAATGKLSHAVLNAVTSTGVLQFRPVLCIAESYVPSNSSPSSLPHTCSSTQYEMTSQNLAVGTAGQIQNKVPPDPSLTRFPSSPPAYNDSNPAEKVLIPNSANDYPGAENGPRSLLGPSSVSNSDVTLAQAVFVTPSWYVDLNLTPSGTSRWEQLAEEQFHAYIAVDLDGQVLSAPLIEPSEPTFTSIEGGAQIAGNFTQSSAENLALLLDSGPLPVPLTG